MQITYGQRISPFPVYMQGVGHFKSPKMSEIYNPDVGDNIYYVYLCLLGNDPSVILKMLNRESMLPKSVVDTINIFDLWCSLPDEYVQMLLAALNFFMVEDVVFYRDGLRIEVTRGEDVVGIINKDNYADVCDLIRQLNVLSRKESNEHETSRFRNEAARKLHERLYGDESQDSDKNRDLELSNLISAIATKSRTYNYNNIWDLTVCQLYDVFFRENNNIAIDAAIMRWCIWGTENCEAMDKWYKSLDLKEEK